MGRVMTYAAELFWLAGALCGAAARWCNWFAGRLTGYAHEIKRKGW
ncbi:MAG: hypothetical protein ACM31D_04710 [Bacteroidota bacterium]